MAYTGKRPVLPVQNSTEFVHPKKGVGKYSNWSLFSTTHLLEDAPLADHTPGEGRHPGDYAMSRWFTGADEAGKELADPGHEDSARFRPWEYKGISEAIGGDYGHDGTRELSTSRYSNWVYDGLDGLQALDDPGNGETAATYGAFNPWDHQSKAVTAGALEDAGMSLPEGYDHPYGRNRVNEWRGVTEAL